VRWGILDTSVYIDHWTGALAPDALAGVAEGLIIRQSAVVLSELRRGARGATAVHLVEALHRSIAIWEPSADDWWEAGALVQAIGDARHWEIAKRRELQNDALIALTARRQGAVLVTRNQHDFALLAKRIRFRAMYV
jgi:predicted nucleic acid-binding protein